MDWKRIVFLVVAGAALLQAAPQLQLSTTAIGPLNIAQNANGPTQAVTAKNVGTGSLSLSVTASAAWLTPTVVNGTSIEIALNTAALSPGDYTEFVTVTAPGAVDAPQTISVTVQIGGLPSSLTFYAAPGGPAQTQQVITQGRVSSQATTLSGSGWLSVSLSGQGSFTSYYPYNVTVTPQPGETAGIYSGTVTFSGSPVPSDNRQVPVTFNLTASPIQQFSPASLQLASSGTAKASATVNTLNTGQGTLAITAVQASAAWLSATVNGTALTVTADPTGLSAGTYQGTLTLASNAANTAAGLPVEFTVQSSTAPILSFGGVVDNATYGPTLSPGMIAQVYGIQLAGATPSVASSLPLSTTLGGVQVAVNGMPAPIYYASSSVVDFVVPFGTQPGPATVTLTYNGVTGNTVSATVAARAPRILYFPLAINGLTKYYGIMTNSSDGSFPIAVTAGLNSHPAKRGDTLTLYVLGMGLTDQNVADGAASPISPLANTPVPTVILGGGFATPTNATVTFSGLAPHFVGLYQVNFTIPPDAPLGNPIALEIQMGSGAAMVTSNPVFLAISN